VCVSVISLYSNFRKLLQILRACLACPYRAAIEILESGVNLIKPKVIAALEECRPSKMFFEEVRPRREGPLHSPFAVHDMSRPANSNGLRSGLALFRRGPTSSTNTLDAHGRTLDSTDVHVGKL
jgi:hypothetical protein